MATYTTANVLGLFSIFVGVLYPFNSFFPLSYIDRVNISLFYDRKERKMTNCIGLDRYIEVRSMWNVSCSCPIHESPIKTIRWTCQHCYVVWSASSSYLLRFSNCTMSLAKNFLRKNSFVEFNCFFVLRKDAGVMVTPLYNIRDFVFSYKYIRCTEQTTLNTRPLTCSTTKGLT